MLTVPIFLLFLPAVMTYPDGAQSSDCAYMTPSHGVSAQTASAPYTVSFNSSTYSPSEQIKVTLAGTSSAFKGFLIEPRSANAATTYTTYGTITNIPSNAKNPCSPNAGLTHTSNSAKSSVSFTWIAPPSNVGSIVFVYTVVQTERTFWVRLNSPTLTFSGPVVSANYSSSTTASTSTTTTSSTMHTGQCGVSVNCYPAGVDCSTSCNFLVMWLASTKSDSVMFTLKKKITLSNYYIAIGFSKDQYMGDDSVVACISTGGLVTVKASYNPGEFNNVLDNSSFGLTLINSSYSNGMLSCSFSRKVSAGNDTNYQTRYFDLTNEHYLLVVDGASNAGDIKQHIADNSSPNKINFLASPTISASTTLATQTSTGMLVKHTECGTSLGCFHDCASDGTSCSFLLTWTDIGDSIAMTLTCKRSSNEYCAIGLSSDNKMGDDSVIQCVPYGNTGVYLSYNAGTRNKMLDGPQIGLSEIVTSYADGILLCKFSRKKTATLANASAGRKKRATMVDATLYKDMNSDWTLMLAYGGGSSDGSISQHAASPVVSSQPADFQSFADIGAKATVNRVAKAHGILMIVAWLLCATFGIFMARFYKTVWPQGMEWRGNKRWFAVHRACMFWATLLTAVSFAMIFIDVKGYAEISGSTFEKSHPIIGIIITGLAVINPVMSLFRCGPGTPNRPIFNWAHRCVGVSAHVLAVINIFSGVLLAESQVSRDVMIPLWIYVGWFVLMEILLFCYDSMTTRAKRPENFNDIRMNDRTDKPVIYQQEVDKCKVLLLIIHLVALLVLTIAVCVTVGLVN